MRPEYIEFEAFGSYLERTRINFSAIDSEGIFLICGPTGGGKTTLLDAMSVALYGKATGALRGSDRKLFRCRLADRSIDTRVDFAFSLGSERYRFFRRWRMGKAQGEDILREVENACYHWNGTDWGEPVSAGTTRSLENEAVRILGLTHSQFVKVICLPQGEFRELLTADSTEKTKIFERLFGTARWKTIAEAASRRALATEAEIKELRARIDGLLTSNSIDNPSLLKLAADDAVAQRDQLKDLIDEIAVRLTTAEENLSAALAVDDRFVQLDRLRNRLTELEAQRENIDKTSAALEKHSLYESMVVKYTALSEAHAELQNAVQRLESCDSKAAEAARLLAAASEAYAKIDEQREHSNALHESLVHLKALKDKADRLDEAQKELARCETSLSEIDGELAKCDENAADIAHRIEKGRDLLSRCDSDIAALPECSERHNTLAKNVEQLEALEQKQKILADARRAAEESAEKSAGADDAFNKKKFIVAGYEALISADTAYSLSLTLADDMPCPVCGSVHHPSPAQHPAELPDESLLAAARDELATAQKEAEDAAAALAKHRAAFELAETQFAQVKSQCDTISLDLAAAREARDKAGEQLKYLNGQVINRSRYTQRLDALTEQQDELQQTAKKLTEKRTALISARAAAAGKRDALLGELGEKLTSPDALSDLITLRDKEHKDAEDAIRRVTEAYNNARLADNTAAAERKAACGDLDAVRTRTARLETDYSAECLAKGLAPDCDVTAQLLPDEEVQKKREFISSYAAESAEVLHGISRLEEETAGQVRPKTDELRELRNALSDQKNELISRHGQAITRAQQLTETLAAVSDAVKNCEQFEARYGEEKRISSFLSGQNPKKTPIDQFVAGLLLDEVIVAANGYWGRLSRGQYALRRMSETYGRSHYQGVNFEVVDTHIGGTRPLATLSGGELFLASLSLAFGLSDVVQSFSGGIRLDSIFIDEGFGSLDRDTLDLAMRSISEIRGGRLIGIISHVEELRSRITSRLEVTKDENGSHLIRRA